MHCAFIRLVHYLYMWSAQAWETLGNYHVYCCALELCELGICYFHNAWCPPRDLIHIHTQAFNNQYSFANLTESSVTMSSVIMQRRVFTRLEDNTANMHSYRTNTEAETESTVEPLYNGHHWEPTFCLL